MQVAGIIKHADIVDACCVHSAITQDADQTIQAFFCFCCPIAFFVTGPEHCTWHKGLHIP